MVLRVYPVVIAGRIHPFPSRTRQLSFLVPKILGWRRPGKIGTAGFIWKTACCTCGLSLFHDGFIVVYGYYAKEFHDG